MARTTDRDHDDDRDDDDDDGDDGSTTDGCGDGRDAKSAHARAALDVFHDDPGEMPPHDTDDARCDARDDDEAGDDRARRRE